ncbi:6647_t:CDS:2, partial [Entrophospora sp. SA101]
SFEVLKETFTKPASGIVSSSSNNASDISSSSLNDSDIIPIFDVVKNKRELDPRNLGKQYLKNDELITSKQVKHQKVKSIIYDEDVRLKVSGNGV